MPTRLARRADQRCSADRHACSRGRSGEDARGRRFPRASLVRRSRATRLPAPRARGECERPALEQRRLRAELYRRIGVEITRGLARRGAELVVPCRSRAKGEALLEQLRTLGAPCEKLHRVDLDLEDLDSVRACATQVERIAAGRPLDVLVENAGVWPRRYRETRQGHEIAFGVNVLAHLLR